MNNKKRVYLWVTGTFLTILLAGTFAAFLMRDENKGKDTLVVWGQTASDPAENWRECRLWLFEPETQKTSSPVIQEDTWCGYEVVYINGKQRLREITSEGKIILYNITSEQTIELWQSFDLKSHFPQSPPQWGKDGSIYFSALENNQEQIYRFDSKTGTTSPFILFASGLAADPLISPDGNYLVYWTLEGPTNRFPNVCGLGCVGYYHIYNLQTHTDTELFSLLEPLLAEPFIPHCLAKWAATGRYLAFNIGGCGDWGAQELVVFDAYENQIVALFELTAEDVYFAFEGWLSNTEIVYIRGRVSPELGITEPSYWVYSVEQQTSRELVESPPDSDNLFILRDLDWTPDSRFIVGALKTTSPQSLIIVDASRDSLPIEEFSYEDEFSNESQWLPFQEPKLSLSGDWIAYFSSFKDEQGILITNVYVVNRVTKDVVSLNTTNIVRNLHFAWVQSQ